jgi:Fanconi anemia group M protein
MKITADYRERSSGIIDLMIQAGIDVTIEKMTYGDYIINDRMTIERKTAADFLLSLIDGRLFKQVGRLKNNTIRPLLFIEGNPFRTDLKVSRSAIQGALLSIQTIFYLPIVYTRSGEKSVEMMQLMARQIEKNTDVMPLRSGYRPRKLASRQLYIVQGLPGIGPRRAKRLLKQFDSVTKVLTASIEKLSEVNGIGPLTAKRIREVLDASWCHALNLEQPVSDGQIKTPHQPNKPRITPQH